MKKNELTTKDYNPKAEDLLFGTAQCGADAFCVESIEDAEVILEDYRNAPYYGIMTSEDEDFEMECQKLDCEAVKVRKIYWYNNGIGSSFVLGADIDL